MQNIDKLESIKAKLPYGALSLIALKSGCSRVTVSNYFKGTLKKEEKIFAIQNSIIQVLESKKGKIEDFFKTIEEM